MTHNPQCGKCKYSFGHNKHKFLKDSETTTYLWNVRLWSLDQQEMQNKLQVSSMCHPQSPQQCERLRHTTQWVQRINQMLQDSFPQASCRCGCSHECQLQEEVSRAIWNSTFFLFHVGSLIYLFYVTIWWALMSIIKNVLLPHLILCLYQVTITLKFFWTALLGHNSYITWWSIQLDEFWCIYTVETPWPQNNKYIHHPQNCDLVQDFCLLGVFWLLIQFC